MNPKDNTDKEQLPLMSLSIPMPSGYTICMEMCWNGVWIRGTITMRVRLIMGRFGIEVFGDRSGLALVGVTGTFVLMPAARPSGSLF